MSAAKRKKAMKKNKGGDKKGRKKEEPTMSNMLETEGEIDFEKLVRTEHLKLQREYRLMEDRRHHLAGAGNALSKQARLVELLRDDCEDLETDLYNAESIDWRKVDRQSVVTIVKLLEILEKALADKTYCLKNMSEMASHVDRITKNLVDHHLKVQSIYGRSMTVPQAERRMKILENRLYLTTTRVDTKVWHNKGLREEINMMLKLRALFYQRHLINKRQLAQIRNKMMEIVFTATQAYEQRDELAASIHTIKEKNDKDTRQHVLEIKEFFRILNSDAKAREFNTLKNKERDMLESARQRDVRRNMARRDEMDATLNSYTASFKQILSVSNYDSLESLIKHYEEIQQENFARFVAISDINDEASRLRDENDIMCEEIEIAVAQLKDSDGQKQQQLDDAAYIVEKGQDELDQLKRVLEIGEQQMKETLEVLEELFQGAGCSADGIMRLLGMEEKSARTAILSMRAIERRGRELLLEKQTLELRKAVEKDEVPLARATQAKQGTQVKVSSGGGPYVPDVIVAGRVEGEDDEEDEDRGTHILSVPEYRIKVQEKMQIKRELEFRTGRGTIAGQERASVMTVATVWDTT